MKKYPYIGEHATQPIINLFTKKGFYIRLIKPSYDGKEHPYDSDTLFVDITEKYLSNTWGIVESKEHAEFIIELAELHGFVFASKINGNEKYFRVMNGFIWFYESEINDQQQGFKKITIPLPPKSDKPSSYNLPKKLFANKKHWNLVSNNNYSWVSDCKSHEHLCSIKTLQGFDDYREVEMNETETWPNLGDRVTVYGQQGNVILPPDKNGFYIIDADGLYLAAKVADITKPKSKEDLLIEELQAKLCENNYVDNYTLANDIVNGMIEGLVYVSK